MGQEKTGREQIINEYHLSVEPLLRFIPWLEQHAGEMGRVMYGDEGISEHSLSFPVSTRSGSHIIHVRLRHSVYSKREVRVNT